MEYDCTLRGGPRLQLLGLSFEIVSLSFAFAEFGKHHIDFTKFGFVIEFGGELLGLLNLDVRNYRIRFMEIEFDFRNRIFGRHVWVVDSLIRIKQLSSNGGKLFGIEHCAETAIALLA